MLSQNTFQEIHKLPGRFGRLSIYLVISKMSTCHLLFFDHVYLRELLKLWSVMLRWSLLLYSTE